MGTCFWEAPLWKKLLGIFGDVRDIRQESACSTGTVVKAFGHPDRVALRAAESLEVVKVLLLAIQLSPGVCVMSEE